MEKVDSVIGGRLLAGAELVGGVMRHCLYVQCDRGYRPLTQHEWAMIASRLGLEPGEMPTVTLRPDR